MMCVQPRAQGSPASSLHSWVTPWMLSLPQRRQGMDIKQMKNFVSQELKGLKQEHRLLSLRRCWDGKEREAPAAAVGA